MGACRGWRVGSPTTCPWFDLRLRPAACAVRLLPVIGYGDAGTGGRGPGRSDADGPGRQGWHTGGEGVIRRWSATRGWWDGRGRRSEAGTGSVLPVADHAVGPFAGLGRGQPQSEWHVGDGLAVREEHRNRGLCTAAAARVLVVLSGWFPGEPVMALIRPDNAASLRVAQKVCMRETA